MRGIRIGAAQFEHRNADKNYNLSAMKQGQEGLSSMGS
jgi:hypothetical protein